MTVVARGERTRQAMPGDHVSVTGVSSDTNTRFMTLTVHIAELDQSAVQCMYPRAKTEGVVLISS